MASLVLYRIFLSLFLSFVRLSFACSPSHLSAFIDHSLLPSTVSLGITTLAPWLFFRHSGKWELWADLTGLTGDVGQEEGDELSSTFRSSVRAPHLLTPTIFLLLDMSTPSSVPGTPTHAAVVRPAPQESSKVSSFTSLRDGLCSHAPGGPLLAACHLASLCRPPDR